MKIHILRKLLFREKRKTAISYTHTQHMYEPLVLSLVLEV
jgi:hypothetical protein